MIMMIMIMIIEIMIDIDKHNQNYGVLLRGLGKKATAFDKVEGNYYHYYYYCCCCCCCYLVICVIAIAFAIAIVIVVIINIIIDILIIIFIVLLFNDLEREEGSEVLTSHEGPCTQPSEPILFPKLRIYSADFPYLLCSIDQRLLTAARND